MRWMLPYFGASVYEDPAVYAQSSAINFIRNVKTPTFEYVGELRHRVSRASDAGVLARVESA